MTKLKYGKLYINKEDILKAAGLPSDCHLEILGADQLGVRLSLKLLQQMM